MLMIGPHGAVMAKWPRKRGRAKQGYDLYRQLEFGQMAKWAANPLDLDLATAVEMAKGTEQVPRDIMMMAMQGGYYEIVSPEGIVWEQARMTTNAQYILDQVTDVRGAILYRAEQGWMGLLPGLDGQTLAIQHQQPFWGEPSGMPSASMYGANTWGGESTTASATKGQVYVPILDHQISALVSWATEINGAEYRWSIWRISATNVLEELIANANSFIASASGAKATVSPFPAPVSLHANVRYGLLFTRLDGTNTSPAGLRGGGEDPLNLPIVQTDAYLRYDKKTLSVGDTPSTTGSNPYAYGALIRI